jgi:hypothetical protein
VRAAAIVAVCGGSVGASGPRPERAGAHGLQRVSSPRSTDGDGGPTWSCCGPPRATAGPMREARDVRAGGARLRPPTARTRSTPAPAAASGRSPTRWRASARSGRSSPTASRSCWGLRVRQPGRRQLDDRDPRRRHRRQPREQPRRPGRRARRQRAPHPQLGVRLRHAGRQLHRCDRCRFARHQLVGTDLVGQRGGQRAGNPRGVPGLPGLRECDDLPSIQGNAVHAYPVAGPPPTCPLPQPPPPIPNPTRFTCPLWSTPVDGSLATPPVITGAPTEDGRLHRHRRRHGLRPRRRHRRRESGRSRWGAR